MTKPNKHGTCYIIHHAGDQKNTYSSARDTFGDCLDIIDTIELMSPGLRGKLQITKYINGKPENTCDI